LSYYVVDDLQTGLQAVHLLDNNKKGKANFFLLNKIGEIASQSEHALNGAIPAMSVVEVDDKYRNLARHLLGNVYIAEGEEALENANGNVVIEKNGKYVKGKFTLTGGSVGLIEGKKIGRAKNLEKLQAEIVKQENIVRDLQAEIQKRHNEVIAFNEDLRENAIRELGKSIQQLSNQVFTLQNKLENIQSQQNSAAARLTDLNAQLENIQVNIEESRQQLVNLSEVYQLSINKLNEIDQFFKEAEADFAKATQAFNEFNLHVTRQQSKINALRQELGFKENQLKDLKTQVEQSALQLSDTARDIQDAANSLQTLEETLLQLMRSREDDKRNLDEADQAYYNFRNRLNEKESELRLKTREKEQVEHLLAAIKDRLNELKLKLAGTRERLDVEFRIKLDDILDEGRTTETPLEDLQEKADRLKKRLENLGEVNPTAIEAFTEMKKRYEFIVEQKNDLVNAKESLLKTIEEVESTANQKFLETFNLVRDNFQQVFKSLFTEDDQCDLILENPENLAETGIDVIAKPKGKRPTSLTQLSGGERTLTATALLFAIYLIKPAPFCILDEVDAPLDDANVGKFTNMIRQFSDNSQFIIVTHNKTTMSTVDVIYGVTMQEPGVSKLVSVDFRSLAASQN
jgi:chromosome segregation protein